MFVLCLKRFVIKIKSESSKIKSKKVIEIYMTFRFNF